MTRIAITGLGGVCSIGANTDAIWRSMIAGRSGIGPLPTYRHELRTRVGCALEPFDDSAVDPARRPTMALFSVLAVVSAAEALAQSGLTIADMDATRVGAVAGVAIWGADAVEQSYLDIFVDGKKRANIFTVPRAMPSAPAGQISMHLGLRGPVFGVTSACSSSNNAIASAVDQLRLGRADVMIAGGADASVNFSIVKVWESLRVLARGSCRPFSADRDGLVLGDGGAMVVLETWDHAVARGAPILAEIVGCGLSADASDIVSPTVEGPAEAMRACLADAGLSTSDVDYINAHGTGTKANDRIETAAIRSVFGSDANGISVSSTKSMHGHCMGASGALEMIACVNAVRHGIIPPTIGYNKPDPECDLDVTPNMARERSVTVAMSNAFAFGGLNAVLAVKKV